MNEINIAKKNIFLSPEIKKGRIKIIVKSKVFYEFIIEVDFPYTIKYEDLIKGIFDGLYIKPNIYDIFFYFVNIKKKIPELTDTIYELGLSNDSYLIYLDEKKYIETSCVIKSEVYIFKHEEKSFAQIPVYLEQNEDNFFLDSKKKCNNIVKKYYKDKNNIDFLPLIVIKYFEYQKTIDFLKSYYKYIKFRSIPILIEKLIIPAKEEYIINHIPNNKEANFFMEATDTNNYKIYTKKNIEEIISLIKIQANRDKIYFQKNDFRIDIEKWVRTVFNILAEYIQFQLNINPIYYVCKNCLYPIIFLDKRNVLSYMDLIIKKLDKRINDDINILNCLINLITPSYFKDDSLPEINVLYFTEDKDETLDKDSEIFSQNISGCFTLCSNLKELEIILKEINLEYSKDNKVKFQLILSPNTCEQVANFILDNNYILLFDNICIYSKEYNTDFNDENIRIVFESVDKDIHVYESSFSIIQLFFNIICKTSKTSCYKFTKIINYNEYIETYYKFHEKISLHYGNISYLTFNNNIGIIQDFINSMEEKNLKIKTNVETKKKALINALLVFENIAKQKIENFKDVISVYTKETDSFYQDLNNWLRELDSLAYDKIGYFVSDFMYCLNKYGDFKKTGIIRSTILYRGIRINLIDLLFYKRNINKIITFPSFTSCSLDLEEAKDFSDRNLSLNQRKESGLFSVIFTVYYRVNNSINKDKYYPVSFDISDLNRCGEKEVLFQPFTFFKIKKVNINLENYTADITLSTIKKLEILELYIKDKFKLKYNKNYNIVDIPEKTQFSLIKSNENFHSDESEDEKNSQNVKMNNYLIVDDYNEKKNEKKKEKEKEKEKEKKPIINEFEVLINLVMNLEENEHYEDYYQKDKYKSERSVYEISGSKFFQKNKAKIDLMNLEENEHYKDYYQKDKYKSERSVYEIFGSKFFQKNKAKIDLTLKKSEENESKYTKIELDQNGYLILLKDKEKKKSIIDVKRKNATIILQEYFIIKYTNVKDMSYMFYNSSNLLSINNISNWDTSNVINMKSLFEGCTNLNNLESSLNWDTSKVTDMSNMFKNCKKFNIIPDISNWNLSQVKNIDCFFYGCENIQSIINIFNINNSPQLKSIISIFEGCSKLESLPEDLSEWDLSNVTNIKSMFSDCVSLKFIPNINTWNTKNITNISFLFNNCSSLLDLCDLSDWKTRNMIDISFLFNKCSSLDELPDISQWNTLNIKNMSSLFCDCSMLDSLPDISEWNTKNVVNMNSIFKNCSNLTSLPDLSNWDTSNVINMGSAFSNCSSLETLPYISKWNTNKVTNLSNLFYNCKSLTSLPDISEWDTQKVNNMSSIFEKCELLKSVPNIFGWKTENVINMSSLFNGCKSLSLLPQFSYWKTDKVTNMSKMFCGCESLTSMVDFSKWDISKVKDISEMFHGCKLIKRFPKMNEWKISSLENASEMFSGCSSLEVFPSIGNWRIEGVKKRRRMFYGCAKIKLSLPVHFGTL